MSARGDVGGGLEEGAIESKLTKRLKGSLRVGLIYFLISNMANYGAVFVSLKNGKTPQEVENSIHRKDPLSKILSPIYFIGKPARELAYWQYEKDLLK